MGSTVVEVLAFLHDRKSEAAHAQATAERDGMHETAALHAGMVIAYGTAVEALADVPLLAGRACVSFPRPQVPATRPILFDQDV